MKITCIILCLIICACNNRPAAPVPEASAPHPDSAMPVAKFPTFAYPVVYAHWKMGDPENTRLVLDMYKAWDEQKADAVAGYFADSAVLDLPGATRISVANKDVMKLFKKLRGQYGETSNDIIAAYTLENEDNGDDWVMIMTYNKWKFKGGKKDSVLYLDNWKLKDNKIVYLNSLEQRPSKALLKQLEEEK